MGICLNIRRFPSLFACRPERVRARVTGPGRSLRPGRIGSDPYGRPSHSRRSRGVARRSRTSSSSEELVERLEVDGAAERHRDAFARRARGSPARTVRPARTAVVARSNYTISKFFFFHAERTRLLATKPCMRSRRLARAGGAHRGQTALPRLFLCRRLTQHLSNCSALSQIA